MTAFNAIARMLRTAVVLVAALLPASALAATNWDLTVYLPLTTPAVTMLQDFSDDVKDKTGGEVVITLRAAGELPYAASEYHRAVGTGEIAMADTAFLTADIAAAGVLTSSFLVGGYDEMERAMTVMWPALQEQLGAFGAEPLMWTAYAPVLMWGNGEPVTDIGKISGMKVRALSAENAELLSGLGAVPVTMATPEVMTALQYGTVNAILTSPYGLASNKWVDSFKWAFDLGVAMTPTYLIVSKQMMDDLSEDNRAVIRSLAAEYQPKWVKLAREIEVKSLEDIKAAGIVVNEPSAEDRAKLLQLVQPIWQKWAEKRGGNTPELLQSVRTELGR